MGSGLFRVVSRNRYDLAVGTARCKVLHPSRALAEQWARFATAHGYESFVEEAKVDSRRGEPSDRVTGD